MGAVRQRRRPLYLGPAVAAVAVAAYLSAMAAVVERFESIFKDLNIELPGLTLDVIRISRFLHAWSQWLPFLGIGVLAMLALWWYCRIFSRGVRLFEGTVVRLPWLGRMLRLRALSGFLRDLGLRLADGGELQAALSSAVGAVGNRALRNEFAGIGTSLAQGHPFPDALAGFGLHDDEMKSLSPLGSGCELGLQLQGIADGIDEESDAAAKAVSTRCYRWMVALMVVISLVFAWAMMSPLMFHPMGPLMKEGY